MSQSDDAQRIAQLERDLALTRHQSAHWEMVAKRLRRENQRLRQSYGQPTTALLRRNGSEA